jgi:hypothetical protein
MFLLKDWTIVVDNNLWDNPNASKKNSISIWHHCVVGLNFVNSRVLAKKKKL